MALTNDDLSIKLYFDLDSNRFRIKDNTDYAGASVSTANVVGVYSYTDPNGNPIYENPDFDNPDVDVDSSLYSEYVSFTAVEGTQTIVYSVYDSDTTYTKTFTFTYDADDIPDVVIGIESNVALATIESTDETAYADNITLNTRTHTLTYPASWGSTTSTSILVDSISLTNLYTGRYVGSVESNITIAANDDFQIDITISGTQNHDVWDSDGMYAVRAALDTFYDRWITAQTSNPKLARQYAETWNQINSNYAMFNSHKQNGDVENAGEYLNNIQTLLAAEDIDTTIDPSVSVPVSASLPGYASQWLSGSGEPSASTGRIVDFYYRTDTNQVYTKATGTWAVDGTLGANTIIQFSANGSTGWTTTYANGLNYIRFSGNGGVTWTVASKFIDGYIYFAYASDDSGTDFICTDQTGFTFDTSLEYIAVKKFSQEYTDELTASDFTGYFTRYKGEGVAFSIVPSTIVVPYDPNTDTYDYTNAKANIYAIRGNDDLTETYTYAKGTETNVTATVNASTGLVTITNMTANGNVQVVCSKSGEATVTLPVNVVAVSYGVNSVIAFCTTPSVSIPTDADGNNAVYPTEYKPTIYVYDGSEDVTDEWTISIDDTVYISAVLGGINNNIITLSNIVDDYAYVSIICSKDGYDNLYVYIPCHKTKAGQAVIDGTSVDDVTIGLNGSSKLEVKDGGISGEKLDDYCMIQAVGSSLSIPSGGLSNSITAMSYRDIALYDVYNTNLQAYRFNGSTWSSLGSPYVVRPSHNGYSCITALNTTDVVIYEDSGTSLQAYRFNGSTWSTLGNPLNIGVHGGIDCVALSSSSIALVSDGGNWIRTYGFDGSDWSLVGSSYSVTITDDVSCSLLYDNTIVVVDESWNLQAYTFDGSAWSTVGNNFNTGVTSSNVYVVCVDSRTVIYSNVQNDTFYVAIFDGTDWNKIDYSYYAGNNRFTMAILPNKLFISTNISSNTIQAYARVKIY